MLLDNRAPFKPRAEAGSTKYGTKGAFSAESFASLNLSTRQKEILASTANAGLAKSTWSAYNTGMKMFQNCCTEKGLAPDFPLKDEVIITFVAWLLDRNLSASTISTYVASLRHLHMTNGHSVTTLRSATVDLLIEGRKHLDAIKKREGKNADRLPVTPTVMRLLKKLIKESAMDKHDKATIWAIATTGFAGALRMHEILARNESYFDPHFTLLKEDLKLTSANSEGKDIEILQIKVKCEKKDRVGVNCIIDIYESGGELCPIKAIKRWLSYSRTQEDKLPAFRDLRGKPFTGSRLNKLLRDLLSPHIDYKKGKITAHSFRSGLPSMMNELGYTDEQIKAIGRWSSQAFKLYTKLPRTSRLAMAKSIANCRF